MNRKILVGSTIAVAILIGVSFTSVVGYNSVESNVKESPLFNIRTSRANGLESNKPTCNYIDQGNTLPFPKRDEKTVLIQKVIDSIIKMDDETLNSFTDLLINHKSKRINKEYNLEIINILFKLKINPDELKDYVTDEKQNKFYTEEYCETFGFIWVPGCFIALMITYIIWLVHSFATIILDCL